MAINKRNYIPGEFEEIFDVSIGSIIIGEWLYFELDGFFKFELSDITIKANGNLMTPGTDYELKKDQKYSTIEADFSGKILYGMVRFLNPATEGYAAEVSGNNFGTMIDNEAVKNYIDDKFDFIENLPHDDTTGKNDNPNFLHTTQTQQDDWDDKVDDDDPRLSDAREWTADTVSQSEAEAGTATTRRAWTAERVRQAIVSWWDSISVAWDKIIDKPSKFPPEEHGDSAHSEDYAKSDDLDDYVSKAETDSQTLSGSLYVGDSQSTTAKFLRVLRNHNGDEYGVDYVPSWGSNSPAVIRFSLRNQTTGVTATFEMGEDGTIVAPECTNAGVDAGSGKTLVHKEWVEEKVDGDLNDYVSKTTTSEQRMSGDLVFGDKDSENLIRSAIDRNVAGKQLRAFTIPSDGYNGDTSTRVYIQEYDGSDWNTLAILAVEEDGTIVAPDCTNAGVDAGVPETLVTKDWVEERGLGKWEALSDTTLPDETGTWEIEGIYSDSGFLQNYFIELPDLDVSNISEVTVSGSENTIDGLGDTLQLSPNAIKLEFQHVSGSNSWVVSGYSGGTATDTQYSFILGSFKLTQNSLKLSVENVDSSTVRIRRTR